MGALESPLLCVGDTPSPIDVLKVQSLYQHLNGVRISMLDVTTTGLISSTPHLLWGKHLEIGFANIWANHALKINHIGIENDEITVNLIF